MTWRNDTRRFGVLSISLHWLMLVLLAAVYACIELREFFPKGSGPREALKTWHFMLGLSVLVLVLARIAVRLAGAQPGIEPAPPLWQKRVAQLMHVALYALMVGMPLAGWALLSAKGKAIPFFSLQLPPLIGADNGLAEVIQEVHETAGTGGYFLIGLHAAAAVYHHFIVRDDTLRRMLPARG